jgi:DNA modification methylase
MTIRAISGDCRTVLLTLPDQSVHCVVTSPPYWGLRDYGTAQWQGGDPNCDHIMGMVRGDTQRETPGGRSGSFRGGTIQFLHKCEKCGAARIDSQIGLEPSPDDYLAAMVAVFREVKRVLRDDGTLWLNLGDCYSSIGHKKSGSGYGTTGLSGGKAQVHSPLRRENNGSSLGLKHKDLCGIPWRVAFALQADGWYLRQDIIWSKPNPMPENVRDRCTKAHEYIFLLSKNERYYYDADAIAEPANWRAKMPDGWDTGPGAHGSFHRNGREPGANIGASGATRNKRSVWEVATAPFSEAHFATFPPALIEPCILAGCANDGTVLDPFGGAGTTGLVADRLGRNAILIELNPKYAAMAERRIIDDCPLFAAEPMLIDADRI